MIQQLKIREIDEDNSWVITISDADPDLDCFVDAPGYLKHVDKNKGAMISQLYATDDNDLDVQLMGNPIWYHSMLNAKYREFLIPSKFETLSELIDCARERELQLKRQEDRGEKRKMEKEVGSSKKGKFVSPPKKFGSLGEAKHCLTCGKKHAGECYFKSVVCYKCGKPGHLASQCVSTLNLCYNCYKPGHRRSECPELKGAGQGGMSSGSFKAQGSGKKWGDYRAVVIVLDHSLE
ncbi:hypothetical protein E3N88_40005 [Mikania micrantha]|uniref:CCHC-type domain-containing protein n=1 Tax=Mikania micrantha TaxID=192012 RepID=A0A5N6LNM1_9ASTR|nr:hypothetical protein E3N88_40005 [Mikania micrantha]